LFSPAYTSAAEPICFKLLAHSARATRSPVVNDADNNTAANMAVTTMTTSNSIKVNAPAEPVCRRQVVAGWRRDDLFVVKTIYQIQSTLTHAPIRQG